MCSKEMGYNVLRKHIKVRHYKVPHKLVVLRNNNAVGILTWAKSGLFVLDIGILEH